MTSRVRSTLAAAVAASALLASPAALAASRPQCLPSPPASGACFIDDQVFGSTVLTSVDDDGDSYSAVIPISADDLFKFLPNGFVTAHLSDQEAGFTVCPSTAPASCPSDGAGSLTGTGRLQLNAFLAPGGVVGCPSTISASAVLTDGVSSYDLTVISVSRFGPSGCEQVLGDTRITAVP